MAVEQTRFLPTTEKELVAYVKENGTNLLDKMAVINSAEGWTEIMSAWENIEYSVLVYAVNDYDQGKFIKLTHKTADIEAYAGDIVLGKYTMTCERQKAYNTFTLKHRAGSTTELFVEDFCYEDGNQWYATYDAEAGTLTLSGERRGHEGSSSFTKQLGIINDEESGLTFGYAVYCIDKLEDSEGQVSGTDPFVFTVDPTTKKLSGAKDQKQLVMRLLDLETGGISDAKGYLNYFNFTQGVTISPVVDANEPAPASLNSAVVPFSSVTSSQNNCRKNFVKDISGSNPFRSVKAEIVR